MRLFIRKSDYEMDDGLLDYGGNNIKQGTFYSVERSDYDFTNEMFGNLLAISLVVDAKEDYYERKVYNFFDFTGQLGGLFEILSIVGGIFVAFFAEKILIFSLMNSLYQVENQKDADDHAQQLQNFSTSKVEPVTHMYEEEKTMGKVVNLNDTLDDKTNRDLDEHGMLHFVTF
jgi:hypothetical protein